MVRSARICDEWNFVQLIDTCLLHKHLNRMRLGFRKSKYVHQSGLCERDSESGVRRVPRSHQRIMKLLFA